MTNENKYSPHIPVFMHASLCHPCKLFSGWFVYSALRADNKQARGRMEQTAIKTPTDAHIPSALYTHP